MEDINKGDHNLSRILHQSYSSYVTHDSKLSPEVAMCSLLNFVAIEFDHIIRTNYVDYDHVIQWALHNFEGAMEHMKAYKEKTDPHDQP